jgi:RimJ/RimL family protein N-acetyltransferase
MAAIYADPAVMRFIDTRGEDPSTWVTAYARSWSSATCCAATAGGAGLATEAARACLATAFGDLGHSSVVAVVDEGNDASLAVLRKVGFRRTGSRAHRGRRQHVLRAAAPVRPPAGVGGGRRAGLERPIRQPTVAPVNARGPWPS